MRPWGGDCRPLRRSALLLALAASPAQSQAEAVPCPRAAGSLVESGWVAYRSGDLPRAEAAFGAALARCPGLADAATGLGYTAQREERELDARRWFEAALAADPDAVDALVGLGILAWREGRHDAVRSIFSRVRELDPYRPDAARYLALLPDELGPEPPRPELQRPDTTSYPARVRGGEFQVRTPRGWQPFYVKGVNLGAALPGKHPSEFPDSAVYAEWVAGMAEIGVNTVRVYTVHPPAFYDALARHNQRHSERPIWLIQGVWAELPPRSDYDDPKWAAEYFGDMHAVVDLLHGRASLPHRPGRASGHYTTDVSRWVLAYVLGREWEALSVAEYNSLPGKPSEWRGRYLRTSGASPMDVWLARACDEIISYEMTAYNSQRPVAYTNWPTTDPLRHATESTVAEEASIRVALGDPNGIRPVIDGDDAVALDPSLVEATAEFPAGYFASYHIYPYFPDFMVLDPELNRARSAFGASNYYGYLLRLKAHHADLPVLIAEYGVPASLGTAHLHPQGWHHGGHSEAAMANIDIRMTHEIAAAGMAGGIVFSWIDEWFKKTWNTAELEVPLERNRLWYNRMDAEEHYGILAMEPEPAISGSALAERIVSWTALPALYRGAGGASLRAASDEAYLWVLMDLGVESRSAGVQVGFDTLEPQAGDFRWPGGGEGRLPVGLEFVLQATANEVRLLADTYSNPVRVEEFLPGLRGSPRGFPGISDAPSGFFRGRYQRGLNLPLLSLPNADGQYDSLRVLTSRVRFGRDTTEYAAMGYDWGVLREGPAPDGLWQRSADGRFLEIRIPWMLLNVSDPSQRRVLRETGTRHDGELQTRTIDGIRIIARGLDAQDRQQWQWPLSGSVADVASYTWSEWEVPRWRSRRRPVFDALREAFAQIDSVTPQVHTQND